MKIIEKITECKDTLMSFSLNTAEIPTLNFVNIKGERKKFASTESLITAALTGKIKAEDRHDSISVICLNKTTASGALLENEADYKTLSKDPDNTFLILSLSKEAMEEFGIQFKQLTETLPSSSSVPSKKQTKKYQQLSTTDDVDADIALTTVGDGKSNSYSAAPVKPTAGRGLYCFFCCRGNSNNNPNAAKTKKSFAPATMTMPNGPDDEDFNAAQELVGEQAQDKSEMQQVKRSTFSNAKGLDSF